MASSFNFPVAHHKQQCDTVKATLDAGSKSNPYQIISTIQIGNMRSLRVHAWAVIKPSITWRTGFYRKGKYISVAMGPRSRLGSKFLHCKLN